MYGRPYTRAGHGGLRSRSGSARHALTRHESLVRACVPEPTPAQELGWPAIAAGGNVLVQAPTGSGKTLAAFLLGLDRLNATPGEGLRLLYVSPLKALNYDVERNLRGPLAGIGSALRWACGRATRRSATASGCCARRPTS